MKLLEKNIMKNRKFLIILLFSIIIVGVLIVSIILNTQPNDKKQVDDKTENNVKKEFNVKKTEYNLIDLRYEDLDNKSLYTHRVDNENLYLSSIDFSTSDLGKTIDIVTYNFNNKKTEIIKYADDNRIVDYSIQNDTIYFVTLEYDDNSIRWKLNKSDKSFDNKEILKQGLINSPFIAPSFYIYNNKFYFISYDLNEGNERYDISKIDDNGITTMLEIDGTKEQLLDLEKVLIDNNAIYYICYSDNAQNVKKYDFKSKKTENLYTTNTKGEIIFEIGLLEDYVVIDIINGKKSTFVYLNEKGNKEKIEFSNALTFLRTLNDNKVIMRDELNKFTLISKNNNNNITSFTFEDLDLYPKYVVFNSELLVLSDHSNRYYTYNLKNL